MIQDDTIEYAVNLMLIGCGKVSLRSKFRCQSTLLHQLNSTHPDTWLMPWYCHAAGMMIWYDMYCRAFACYVNTCAPTYHTWNASKRYVNHINRRELEYVWSKYDTVTKALQWHYICITWYHIDIAWDSQCIRTGHSWYVPDWSCAILCYPADPGCTGVAN